MSLIRTSVDILFANEAEITSLYQTSSFEEAAERAARDTKLAAITRSEKGSVILGEGKRIEIEAAPVAKVVDTTGAGDLYAAGFLFGMARDLGLEAAGRLGSLAAAEIISHVGARPAVSPPTWRARTDRWPGSDVHRRSALTRYPEAEAQPRPGPLEPSFRLQHGSKGPQP